MTTISADGREIRLSSLDRILWPRTGTSKGDLLRYLLDVREPLLAHLRGRAVALRRFPNGVEGHGWYQVRVASTAPDWLPATTAPGSDGPVRLALVEDVATLAWAANGSTIELHPYPWPADDPDHPDQLVFDLDPGPPALLQASCRVAVRLRAVLDAVGLDCVPKASGMGGIHVVAGIEPRYAFAQTKAFAKLVASLLAHEMPDLVVTNSSREKRRGKVFVDWVQNDRWRSLVAPYSPRAAPVPVVAAPLRWEEVERVAAGRVDELTLFVKLDQMRRRLERHGDLAEPLLEQRQLLPDEFLETQVRGSSL